ncbi:MAG: SEC-C domain-containing protein, partial [Clostridia bacterium]|nr:SEC-C domain-containing protein [Clostridia bacterium]
AVESHLTGHRDDWELSALKSKYLGLLCNDSDFTNDDVTKEEILSTLLERAMILWKSKEQLFGEEGAREVERVILLRNVDEKWMDHLEAMDDLRESIGLQAYAQRDPLVEYKLAGADIFDDMILNIRDDTARGILMAVPKEAPMKRVQIIKPTEEGFMNFGAKPQKKQLPPKQAPIINDKKIGPNEPCPCGSGKKYKKCCGSPLLRGQQ